jgi:hypothetical protein
MQVGGFQYRLDSYGIWTPDRHHAPRLKQVGSGWVAFLPWYSATAPTCHEALKDCLKGSKKAFDQVTLELLTGVQSD